MTLEHSPACNYSCKGCAPDCPKRLQEVIDEMFRGISDSIMDTDYCPVCSNHGYNHSETCAYWIELQRRNKAVVNA